MSKNNLFDPSKYYIVRAEKAGVFMAKIAFIEGGTVGLNATRRLYYWNGALDVTQLAVEGVAKPNACKFSVQMGDSDLSIVANLIEFHPMTDKAVESLNSVPVWKS